MILNLEGKEIYREESKKEEQRKENLVGISERIKQKEKEVQGGEVIPGLLKKHYSKLLEKDYSDFTDEVMHLPNFSFEAKGMEQVGGAFNEIDTRLSLYDLLPIIIRAKALKELPSNKLREIGWRAIEYSQYSKERDKIIGEFIKTSGGEKEAFEYLTTISRSFQKMGVAKEEMRKNLEAEMKVIKETSDKSDIEYQKLWRVAESYKMVDREFEKYGPFVNAFCEKLGWDKIEKFEEELKRKERLNP